jgi:glutamate synthase (NADPH/NADH) small chain
MQNFLNVNRLDPNKRPVMERIKDFREVYEVFQNNDASSQSERCIQCGDPYCMNKCPLHNYIPHWLKSIAENDLELAFNLSNEPSPFPEIMGRICPHDVLCEGDCTLNDGHGAITIGGIETFITEEGFRNGLMPKFPGINGSKVVSIVGSGPAGLSNATYLLRAGIKVEMYERANRAGGLLTYGIPGFKLDKKIVDRRIKLLEEAGMTLYLNTEVGKDISFEAISNKSDAIFLGLGATTAKRLGLNHENAKGVYPAMQFLNSIQQKNFNENYNKDLEVKDLKVVVIGGGDTAMDCVRTSIREGAKEITCLYRRDAKNMPGSKKEYLNAVDEGVDFTFNASPKNIIVNDLDQVIGIKMIKTILGAKDKSGRQKMEEQNGSEFIVDADMIIMALGFNQEVPSFLSENGIKLDKWNGIQINKTYQTSTSGIYAGGDVYRGADLVVRAAYDGREAAKEMIKALKN